MNDYLLKHVGGGTDIGALDRGDEFPCDDEFRQGDGAVAVYVDTTEKAHFQRFPEEIHFQDLMKREGVRLRRIEINDIPW